MLLLDPSVATAGDDRDLDQVLGHDEPTPGDWWARPAATALLEQATPDARLPMLLLAQVAAGIEATTGALRVADTERPPGPVLLRPGVRRLRGLRGGAPRPRRGGCRIADAA